MQRTKEYLKENTNGLLLLLLAIVVLNGLSLSSEHVQSQDVAGSTVEEAASEESKVLGDVDASAGETANDEEEEIAETIEESSASDLGDGDFVVAEADGPEDNGKTVTASSGDDSNDNTAVYDELKRHLKKYCDEDKSYNKKKCKKYCSKTKGEKEYKSLRKKYCNKDDDDDDEDVEETESPVVVSVTNELTFVAGAESFKMEFEVGETVFALMERAKDQGKIDYKYDDYDWGAYITGINGVNNGDDDKYWMFYVNGKSSSEGCSVRKLEKSDSSIEWKHEEASW